MTSALALAATISIVTLLLLIAYLLRCIHDVLHDVWGELKDK